MVTNDESSGGLSALVFPLAGSLRDTGDPWEPYQLLDRAGLAVRPVAGYLQDRQAAGRPAAALRSYGMDLLRWFRFGWAIGCPWDQATRVEARDFSRWIQLTDKLVRPHWRSGPDAGAGQAAGRPAPGSPNPGTAKPPPAPGVAAAPGGPRAPAPPRLYCFTLHPAPGPTL